MADPTRRTILGQGKNGLLLLLAASACKNSSRPAVCTDVSSLAPADQTVRTSLQYVDRSQAANKDCASCQQFLAAPSDPFGACGTCKIMKGPISPRGYCNAFVAKS